eukprot:jgi/Astpho2/6161/Aster-03576
MTEQAGISDLTHSPDAHRKLLMWTAAAIAIPSAGALLWWLSEKGYNSLTPYKASTYHYRPGSFSAWVADILEGHSKRRRKRAPVRVYMDGCFDMMHYGHANALRQAASLGDELVVGLVPDSEILRCKGPPVQSEAERKCMVDAVKWVGEVMTGVPYDLTPEFLNELFTKHRIDYVIHGDDPCLLPDGTDAYEHAKKMGRFRMIKRTEGVSSTDIVGRMLTCTRVNALFKEDNRRLAKQFSSGHNEYGYGNQEETLASRRDSATRSAHRDQVLSKFMPTSRRLVQFSDGKTAPANAKIVYIDGAFDLFHVGHIKVLQEARKLGDFLLVGLHTNEDVEERRGSHLPIMDVHERCLSLLACKYVDEVIIGAPMEVSQDLITTFNIGLVTHGTISETSKESPTDPQRYAVPKELGIFR